LFERVEPRLQTADPAFGFADHILAILFHLLAARFLLLIPLDLPFDGGAVPGLILAEVDLQRFDDLFLLRGVALSEPLLQLRRDVGVKSFHVAAHVDHPTDEPPL